MAPIRSRSGISPSGGSLCSRGAQESNPHLWQPRARPLSVVRGSGNLAAPKGFEGADFACRPGYQHRDRHGNQEEDAGASGPPDKTVH